MDNAWSWQYDSLGRMWDEEDPDAGHRSYSHDDGGRLVAMTDAKGQTTSLGYDAVSGRLASRTSGAGTVSYVYSQPVSGYFNAGRLTSVVSPSDTLQLDYDALGRTKRQRRTLGGSVYTVSRSYDAGGRVVSTTYPDGDVVGPLGYDPAGRLLAIPGVLSAMSYDAAGRPLTRAHPNATTTSWTWEPDRSFLSRREEIVELHPGEDPDPTFGTYPTIHHWLLAVAGEVEEARSSGA